jgi:hypothetical protein
MSQREQLFWDLYHEQRHMNQLDWYQSRVEEFEKAQYQATILTIVLMTLAGVVSILGSVDLAGFAAGWGVLAVVFPVLATALSTYVSVFAFERQAKLYQDAIEGLNYVEVLQANARVNLPEAYYGAALKGYVGQVEDIFAREQGQWGQLISEIKGATLPGSGPHVGDHGA